MPIDDCEESANERDVLSPQSPQALIQKALNKKSPKSHSNYKFLADYEDLAFMTKQTTEGTDWFHTDNSHQKMDYWPESDDGARRY